MSMLDAIRGLLFHLGKHIAHDLRWVVRRFLRSRNLQYQKKNYYCYAPIVLNTMEEAVLNGSLGKAILEQSNNRKRIVRIPKQGQ